MADSATVGLGDIGGTGRYANVRGFIKIMESGRGKANLEFHLTP